MPDAQSFPDPAWYGEEAGQFVDIMRNLAPDLRLDYTRTSVIALEQFVAATFDPPGSTFVGEGLKVGIGCYIGEVIRRTVGGRWDAQGRPQINGIGEVEAIYPVQKVIKRFTNGPEDSLVHYYDTIVRYAKPSASRKRGRG